MPPRSGSWGGKWAARIWDLKGTAWKVVVGLLTTAVGWAPASVHLRWFDPWLLRLGARSEESSDGERRER